jgi:hypothetical protein
VNEKQADLCKDRDMTVTKFARCWQATHSTKEFQPADSVLYQACLSSP